MDTDPEATPDSPEADYKQTHRLKHIKAGDRSVQLLISTQDHVYDAEDVESGEDSWQVIGSWKEESVPELANILALRQNARNSNVAGKAKFGSVYGSGQKLGTPRGDQSNERE